MNRLVVVLLAAKLVGAAGQDIEHTQAANTRNTPSVNFDVVTVIEDAIENELKHAHYPWAVAVVAFLFGSFMWADGGKSCDALVTLSIAVVVGIIAKQTVLSYWESNDVQSKYSPHIGANVVGLEAGLVAAAVVWKGHKGVMVVVGAAAGFCVASFVNSVLSQYVSPKFAMADVTTAVYTLVCLPFAYAVYKDKHLGLLAFVAPFVGGLFISSAVMFFLTEAIIHSGCDYENTTCNPPNPKEGQWTEFFMMAFQHIVSQPGDKDVGPFHKAGMDIKVSKEHQGSGGVIFADRVALLSLWLVLWVGGCKFQLDRLKRRGDKAAVKAREMLSEALLTRM